MNKQTEIDTKTERLQRLLAAENLGGVLLNAQHNFAWLTGGSSNGIDLSKENGACFLLAANDGKKYILANNIELHRLLAEDLPAGHFEPVEFSWQDEKSSGDFIIKKARSLLGGNKKLASDLSLNGETPQIENLIARCRFELTGAEIERYRKMGKDAAAAVSLLPGRISPGETEIEIARKTRDALGEFNFNSIVTLAGADERIKKFRHPVPTGNRWEKILMIVICARREGLIVNLSRIICAGNIPDDLKTKTGNVAGVFARLLSATRPGTTGAELYQTAAAAYAGIGCPGEINLHHQGGATGYKTREWVAHPQNRETVQKNQAFAWNPSITGTKAEETAIVLENEIEIITTSTDFPHLSVEIDGREYVSPGILSV